MDGDEASGGLGAGACRLLMRQLAVLDVVLNLIELRLVKGGLARRGVGARARGEQRTTGQIAASAATAAIPRKMNHSINKPSEAAEREPQTFQHPESHRGVEGQDGIALTTQPTVLNRLFQ
jgi:hypothetical protein